MVIWTVSNKMCAILGIWDYKNKIDRGLFGSMRDTMLHRGPDDHGLFVDPKNNVGLAHRRLSIIDLSSGGHQPMEKDGLVVTYNGEIYNFLEIKKELEELGVKFFSRSDTEVLLEAYRFWGEGCVRKFRGMFAFGIYDQHKEELILCRDRAGVKPLYYYFDGSLFIFASEIKSITKHPSVKKEIDFDSLALYIRFGYVPTPATIFKNIYKLEPGHFLKIDNQGRIDKNNYWNIADFVKEEDPARFEEAEVLKNTENILTEAFNLRMVSDVPVGIFLSGGIDSSLVAALLKKNSQNKLSTFTIGFKEKRFDEAKYAQKIAQHLGTNHHELYLENDKALEIISKLPQIYDEPFSAASAIPTFLVSEFARSKVKVALSADGGDELFYGYGKRYPMIAGMYENYSKLPKFLSFPAGAILKKLPNSLLEKSVRARLIIAHRDLAKTYSAISKMVYSDTLARQFVKKNVSEKYTEIHWRNFDKFKNFSPMVQIALFDFLRGFSDNILTKVDRASMAVSLEAREPFLDQKIIEYAVSLPVNLKRKNGEEKYLLKKILYKYVPRDLIDRPKHGFSMPIDELLLNSKRNFVEEYLNDARIKKEGILNDRLVRGEMQKFFTTKSSAGVWRLVAFQMWKEYWSV